jgi:hypothetical protein
MILRPLHLQLSDQKIIVAICKMDFMELFLIVTLVIGVIIFFIGYFIENEDLLTSIGVTIPLMFISAIILWLLFGFIGWTDSSKDETFEKQILSDVSPLVDQCLKDKIENPELIKIHGKILFINVIGGRNRSYTTYLSDELQGHFSDKEITVFLIARQYKGEFVGNYAQVEDCRGYRGVDDICVIYWPEKRPLGYISLTSDPPDEVKSPCYGDYIGNPFEVGNFTISKIARGKS